MSEGERWHPHADDRAAGTRRMRENLRLALRAIDAAEGDLRGREKTARFQSHLESARRSLRAALEKVPE